MEDTRILSENIEDYLDENGNIKEEFRDVKKVFLKDLPRWGKKGKGNEGGIKWIECAMNKYEVCFIYYGVCDKVKILDYISKGQKLTVVWNNNQKTMSTSQFKAANLGALMNIIKTDYIYKLNDVLDINTGKIKILKQFKSTKEGKRKAYEYKCLECNSVNIIREDRLKTLNNYNCPVCCNQKTIRGINDIATTHPHLLEYFANKEEALKYSYGCSRRKFLLKCPNCNRKKYMKITNLRHQGFGCICNDGISYPEKFLFSFLEQLLNKDFEIQKKLNFCNNKIYDFYFELNNKKIIIEAHGVQHYEKAFEIKGKRARTLEEEQENDRLKKQLAKENKIHHYIVLDCRKSKLEWIKNSILNSELNELFNLNNIDWNKCEKFASGSLVIKVAELWNEGKSIKEIMQLLKKSANIRRYLKIASNLGLTDYNPKEEMRKNGFRKGGYNKKKLICLNDNSIHNSIPEAISNMLKKYNIKLNSSDISKVCNGKQKCAKGYVFRYLDDKNNIISPDTTYTEAKKVLCLNNNVIYNSIKEISVKLFPNSKVSLSGSISRVCNGKQKDYKGYIFRYIDKDNNIIKPKCNNYLKKERKIICLELNLILNNMKEACEFINSFNKNTRSGISYTCKNRGKTYKGYTFRYLDENGNIIEPTK